MRKRGRARTRCSPMIDPRGAEVHSSPAESKKVDPNFRPMVPPRQPPLSFTKAKTPSKVRNCGCVPPCVRGRYDGSRAYSEFGMADDSVSAVRARAKEGRECAQRLVYAPATRAGPGGYWNVPLMRSDGVGRNEYTGHLTRLDWSNGPAEIENT